MSRVRRWPNVNRSRHHGATHDRSKQVMKRFIIEREIPGACDLTEAELAEISKKSNTAMASLGVPYRWVNSYVAGDKVYCIHEADDEDVSANTRVAAAFRPTRSPWSPTNSARTLPNSATADGRGVTVRAI